MAIVFLAEDLKHKRQVALKLLRPELAAALGAERFLREITTTAKLRHPHILPLFDSGEADGFLYYVMPFVEGESLRSRLDRETQLPIDDATRIAAEVADALSYAHSRGVIHRDIKPENILLENGHAVVADFGIAQAVTDSGGEKLTRTGMALGSPLYMSPEQWSGEPVDARSDLYALACVVYEMLAGSPPFSGPTAQVLMARHAIDPVPALRTARSTVTQAVADTIERALAKVPSDRFPTVHAWREALLRPAVHSAVPAPESAGATVASDSSETRAAEGFWVAVLPFKCASGNADLAALSECLSEGIVTGLSRFSYLKVIAHSSTQRFGSAAVDVRAVGKELGARYVMEGSLRQAGSRLRVAVQLIDAITGAHLWAENYDRAFDASEVFALQDDLVPRIVSTVADHDGILPHSMAEVIRSKPEDQLSPHEAMLRTFSFMKRFTPEEHADVRRILERAVRLAPNHGGCWAMLSMMYLVEYRQGFNERPDPLGRALAAARSAVEIAPSDNQAHAALASALFFRRELHALRQAAERTIELNPMDGSAVAAMGHWIAYAGDWERGFAIAEPASALNPNHAGWHRFLPFYNAYRKGDYRGAHDAALRVNMPGFHSAVAARAAALGQLGELEAANKAVKDLLDLKADFGAMAREEYGKWFDAELTERLVDGLRKAGLAVEPVSTSGTPAPAAAPVVMPLQRDKRAIVVLPFVNRSPDADNEYFSDGLTEEISTDLAGVKSLRVISRTSALRFKGTTKDIPTIGRELGVRYVLEGSVRKAGTSLRISARLVDAETDEQLWAETYAGGMDDVFAIQEEISRKIVSALRIELTDAESRAVAQRPIDNPAAYDCYLRAQYEMYAFTADALDRARKLVDDGLAIIGENPLLLATKGLVAWAYVNFGIRVEERYLDEAAACAVKALAQDPQGYLGIFLRGLVAARRGDIESALHDAQRAYELRPGDAAVGRELTRLLLSAGQEQSRAAGLVFEEVLKVDPLGPLSWGNSAARHFVAGRMVDAQAAARRAVELNERGNPARVVASWWLAVVNLRDDAVVNFDDLGAALPGVSYGSVSLFLGRALRGDADGAVRHVTPQLEQVAHGNEYLALFLAGGYALIGHHEAALRWLRVAVEQGFINYPFLAKHDPFLAPLRGDAGFEDLMQQVQRRWQAFPSSP